MARQYLDLAQVYGAVDQSRANQAQMENNRLQQQRLQRQMEQEQRAQQEQEAIRGVYRGAIETDETGAPRLNEKRLLADLYGVAPEQALRAQEGFTKRDTEAQKLKSETARADLENKKAVAEYLRNSGARVTDQNSYDLWRNEAQLLGAEFVKALPNEYSSDAVKSQLLTADKFLERSTPKYEKVDLGGKIQIVDTNPFTNPSIAGTSLDKTLTPDSILTDERTRSEGRLNRENSRGNAVISASGQAQKPPAGYQWTNEGTLRAIPGGPGDKLPETNQKQITGTRNLQNAITEYQNELGGWKKSDALSPDRRAAMGTKYNNMMLQAKEAYNLGVLNGPDLDILTSVITDPRSLKGSMTSNEALNSQASELSRIMSGIAATSGEKVNPNKGGIATSPPIMDRNNAQMPTKPLATVKSDNDYNKLPKGTRFKAPDGTIRIKQ